MSLVECFRLFGDTIADFVTWKGSGIIFLSVIGIPLALQAFRAVINLYGRYVYEDKEETEDNIR